MLVLHIVCVYPQKLLVLFSPLQLLVLNIVFLYPPKLLVLLSASNPRSCLYYCLPRTPAVIYFCTESIPPLCGLELELATDTAPLVRQTLYSLYPRELRDHSQATNFHPALPFSLVPPKFSNFFVFFHANNSCSSLHLSSSKSIF
jgi:hypothetical protein